MDVIGGRARQDCRSHTRWNSVGSHFMHWMFPHLPAEALTQPHYLGPEPLLPAVLRLLESFPAQRLCVGLVWPPLSSTLCEGFPDSSLGKESACSAEDPGSIPQEGRSAGEGTGYPLQYSWASLMAQLVKSLPVMRETWVRSLGWEGPLEKGKATHFSILAWRIPWPIQSQRVRHD